MEITTDWRPPSGFQSLNRSVSGVEWVLEFAVNSLHQCLQKTSVLHFQKSQIKTVGIISGGAGEDVDQAAELGLDCYITGEFAHEQYHPAEEFGINVIAGGHYGTETMGVSLLKEKVEKELGLRTLFIDLPTDL